MADEAKKESVNESKYWGQFKVAFYKSILDIDPDYFKVSRFDYDSIFAWRERVYCYELYHQLRLHLPKCFPYILHGEIDKKGHHSIGKKIKEYRKKYCKDNINIPARSNMDTPDTDQAKSLYPNPDFVVHKPGRSKNLAVMEVKCTERRDKSEIEAEYKKDLYKLETFICAEGIEYEHGIFLIYGPTDQKDAIDNFLNDRQKELIKCNKLHIFYHNAQDNALYLFSLNEENVLWVKVAECGKII